MSIIRIVQGGQNKSGLTPTQGTKFFLEDGSELGGVYKVVLTAEVNDIWRAEIHCHANITDLSAKAEFVGPSFWRRAKLWLKGGI